MGDCLNEWSNALRINQQLTMSSIVVEIFSIMIWSSQKEITYVKGKQFIQPLACISKN